MATFTINGAEIDTASFEELAAVFDYSNPIDNFFRDRYFNPENDIYLNGEDKVPIGELKTYVPLAPAVLHTAQGQVIEDKTEVNITYIKAPYFKPAIAVTPSNKIEAKMQRLLASMRVISQSSMTAAPTLQDSMEMAAAQAYWFIRESVRARIAIMCRDALLYGKVVVDGDNNAGVILDFGRHADMSFMPAIKWDEAGARPYQDLREMVKRSVKHGKRRPVDALCTSRVFEFMSDDTEFNEKFTAATDSNKTRVFSGSFGGEMEATLRGTCDGIEFWTYDATFTNEDGAEEFMIPEDGFWLISERANPVYFCEIKHRENPARLAMALMTYHVSSNDPSVDKFIGDTSPLPVTINKNGACGGTGFITL